MAAISTKLKIVAGVGTIGVGCKKTILALKQCHLGLFQGDGHSQQEVEIGRGRTGVLQTGHNFLPNRPDPNWF